ncbi:hypothetical protein ACTMTI_48100 [Nonomuraea sp. H19]|uniref:hypothetical protein n=1 Tax=Nonomuraea sp. H19 TaxID=3452206 RepID=UPI003F8CE910
MILNQDGRSSARTAAGQAKTSDDGPSSRYDDRTDAQSTAEAGTVVARSVMSAPVVRFAGLLALAALLAWAWRRRAGRSRRHG